MNWDDFFKAMIAEEHAAYAEVRGGGGRGPRLRAKTLLEQFQYEESVHADILEREYARWRKVQA